VMQALKEFLAAIDTPGGHMIQMQMLILFGFGVLIANPPTTAGALAHDLVVGAIGVLFGSMKGQNGGRVTISDPRAKPVEPAVQASPKP